MSEHKQQYLNEFHEQNSKNCLLDQENMKKKHLTVQDVIKQSLKHGRTNIKIIGE